MSAAAPAPQDEVELMATRLEGRVHRRARSPSAFSGDCKSRLSFYFERVMTVDSGTSIGDEVKVRRALLKQR